MLEHKDPSNEASSHIYPIENGDILFVADADESEKLPKTKDDLMEDFEFEHVMVFVDKKVGAAHSYFTNLYRGVGQNPLKKKFKPDEHNIGEGVVFRCKDPSLASLLAEIANRWAKTGRAVIERDKAIHKEKLVEDKQADYVASPYPIPFINVMNMTEDVSRPRNFYRAFRAFIRNDLDAEEPVSLSKKRGVPCTTFAAYAIKASIVAWLFDRKMPEEIRKEFNRIEALKKTQDTTKLSAIAESEFEHFESMIMSYLEKQKQDTFTAKCIEFLYQPIKKMETDGFCKLLLDNPELFDLGGYFFYRNISPEKSNEPWVISQEKSQELLKLSGKQMHSIVISEEELTALKEPSLQSTHSPK